jgi:HAMP domain-containing protein
MNSAIDALEQSADTLFQQWQRETATLTNARPKAKSQARLTQTFQSYEGLIEVMRQSAAQVDPVLAALNANVESLRDNLNASAVAARKDELDALANDIGALVQQLNSSIVRSDEFIASLQQ